MKKLVLLMLCLMPIVVLAQCFDERFDSGKKLFNQGKYKEAKEKFEMCFKCPDRPEDIKALNDYIKLCDERMSVKLSVSMNDLLFNAEPKDAEYDVKINSNKAWSFSCDSDWCVVSEKTGGLLISCKPNSNINVRKCVINVKTSGKTVAINVTQSGADLDFYLNKYTISFDSLQSTKSVYVFTNAGYWYYDSVPDWCDANKRQDTLYVTCHQNDSAVDRMAKIVVSSNKQKKHLEIFQSAGAANIKTDSNNVVFDSDGGSKVLSVMTNSPNFTCEVLDADWLEVVKENNAIRVICSENTLPISRTGIVLVHINKIKTKIIIEQKAKASILEVSQNNIEFNHNGEIKSIIIDSGNDNWECLFIPEWCNIEKQTNTLSITVSSNNTTKVKSGHFIIKTETKSVYVSVFQKPSNHVDEYVFFESNPKRKPVYIDGNFFDYTPSKHVFDSTRHQVKIGRKQFDAVFNSDNSTILEYNPGSRYMMLTASNQNSVGMMTGFIGTKHFGMFNHFQLGIPVNYLMSNIDKETCFLYSLGPTMDLRNLFSLYAGVGAGAFSIGKEWSFCWMTEFGAMFYIKNIMLTLGYQMQRNEADNYEKDCLYAGLGLYFDRYCEKTENNKVKPRVSDSRRWWSINYIYSLNANGVMFGDIGKSALRGYLKTLYIIQMEDEIPYQSSLTGGLIFTPIPGFIDLCTGLGAGWYYSEGVEWKGLELEAGFIVNIWRFPITVIFHEFELEKSCQHVSVEFGIGFHFGEFNKEKQPQYYY